MINKEDEFN